MQRIVALDGLRGLAAVSVVALHQRQAGLFPFPGANHAVDLFFIMSGYVIAGAYGDRIAQMGAGGFMTARLRKLYPIYGLSLLIVPAFVVFLWAAFGYAADAGVLLGSLPFQALFLPSPPAWVPAHRMAFLLNGPGWSLLWEMAVNLVYALTLPWLSTRVLAAIAGTAAAALVVLGLGGQDLGAGADWPDFHLGAVRVLYGFPLGVLLHRLPGPRWRAPFAVPAALFLLSFFLPSLVTLLVVAPLCVWLATGSPSDHPVLGWAGHLSYPLYAVHVPVFAWSDWVAERVLHLSPLPGAMFGAAAAGAVAWFVGWHADPAMQHWIRRWRASRAAVA